MELINISNIENMTDFMILYETPEKQLLSMAFRFFMTLLMVYILDMVVSLKYDGSKKYHVILHDVLRNLKDYLPIIYSLVFLDYYVQSMFTINKYVYYGVCYTIIIILVFLLRDKIKNIYYEVLRWMRDNRLIRR